jgi:hypothetical protein
MTLQRAGLACLVACVVVAPGAPADQAPAPNPEPLWRAYPLEQTPTSPGAPAPRPRTSRLRPPASGKDAGGSSGWPIPLTAAAAAAVVLLAVALRRVGLGVDPDGQVDDDRVIGVPVVSPRWQGAAGTSHEAGAARRPEGTRRSRARRATTRATAQAARVTSTSRRTGEEHASEMSPAAPRAEPDGGAQPSPKSSSAPVTEVCQIRWRGRACCFHAVATDSDGAEHTIARSPKFDWDEPSPPEPSPQARAALTQLSKELRSAGWRALRAKGVDFDERRWYARRFRRDDAPPDGDVTPSRRDAGHVAREQDGRDDLA